MRLIHLEREYNDSFEDLKDLQVYVRTRMRHGMCLMWWSSE